ncbi:NXPE family member 3 [Aplysia californica]|uniref:NXPE family member 3 n=1 Tax=Aplysia californica TaxID=6500 RepID=A0ABM1AAV1_APLCA|nr:NXPE family member 3 [Aplysia californica]
MTAYVKWIWRDNPDCRWAVRLPQALWQCQNYTSQHTAEEDYERMCHLISCGGPLDPTYMKTPPRKEGLYPFEKFYLSEQPLMDPLLAANESLSVVTFLNKSKSFTIGDTISLRIDLKDGYGHHKTKGGDVVRAWLKGLDDYNRMMMEMRDHGNGTYTATVRLMWAARVARVKVALAYPREYLRALVHLQLVMKSLKLSAGAFNNSEADEATPCSHLPLIPGHEPEDVCNLTDVNGSPWYCGRPIKDKLNCSDFLGSRNLPMPWKERPFLPVTEAEARLLDRSNFEPRIHLMGPKLEIHIEPDAKKNRLLRSPVPCTKVKPAITWQQKSPNGFFYDEVWHPFMCTPKPATIDCYKNLRMVSLGDSNVRSQHQYACDDTSSKHLQKALYKAWHAPLSCENKKLNFTSVWYPHGNPFMSSNWVWAEYGSLIPTSHAIDDLPSTGRTLVLLHHYLHLTTGHMTSMEAMHRSIHAAVVRLLKRNPQARVMIRGPHAAYEGWACHYAAGDMLVPQVEDLVANIYKDVQDRVFYFSPMDMTTATENMEFHPDVQWHIYAAMMSIMCGR